MNLSNIIPLREKPNEEWSDLEITVIFLALIPYVFKLDPKRNKVSFYFPPETDIDQKEMNGLFENWSETIDWHESSAFDLIGRPMTQHAAGVILEVQISNGFNLIYEEVVRQKKETGYGFQKHNRGLKILIWAN